MLALVTLSNLVGSILVDLSFIPLLMIVESATGSGGDLERGDLIDFYLTVALLLMEFIPGLYGALPAEPPSYPGFVLLAGVADA